MANHPAFTVFSKPWPDKSLADLATYIKQMGFDGVELPVREGYPVEPGAVETGLPEAVKIFSDCGVKIGSIAGPTDERTIAACGKAGIPIIRICAAINREIGYLASEAEMRKGFDAILPALADAGVTLGVQNHFGHFIGSAIGIMHFIEDYDPTCIGAVLDLGHCGLDGEPDDMAIDICWSHLAMVNLKAAYWARGGEDENGDVSWRSVWSSGRKGITSWPTIIRELKTRGYDKDICLTAEYCSEEASRHLTGEDAAVLAEDDVQYVRQLWSR